MRKVIFALMCIAIFLIAMTITNAYLEERANGGETQSREYTTQESRGRDHAPQAGDRGIILSSWYGPYFHGRTTASGEEFNMSAVSAAHKDWPIGTKLRVTNPENGLSIVVVINDRGPYFEDRGLDLSYEAARQLGFVSEGVVWLEYEIFEVPGP